MTAVDRTPAGGQEDGLVVERIFDASRELVWRAWTDPDRFRRWYGPSGFSMPVCEIDFRVGGRHLWGLRSPDGWAYWTTGVYREIVPLERFVTTDSLADEHGNVVSAAHYGMGGNAPMETVITVTFEDLGAQTRVTLHQAGWDDDQMAAGAAGGWNQAFDKLSSTLASA